MHSKNESVAVRALEALLDRGQGRPVQGVESRKQEEARCHQRIRVTFVTPPKRDEHCSIQQRACLMGLPEPK
jgi:hypothetical protein